MTKSQGYILIGLVCFILAEIMYPCRSEWLRTAMSVANYLFGIFALTLGILLWKEGE